MSKQSRIALCVFTLCLAVSLTAGYAIQAFRPDWVAPPADDKDVIYVGSTPVEVRNMVSPTVVQPLSSVTTEKPAVSDKPELPSLPKFKSLDELMGMMKEIGGLMTRSSNDMNGDGDIYDSVEKAEVEAPAANAAPTSAPSLAADTALGASRQDGGSDEHSTVNSQVEGVAEGDISLTDGRYIYVSSMQKQSIKIIEIDGADMKQVASIPLTTEDSRNYVWLQEMYVTGDYLITVSSRSEYLENTDFPAIDAKLNMCYWYPSRQFTEYTVYDISDRTDPKLKRSFDVEGNAVSTRMVGNTLYFVSTRYLYSLYMEDMGEADILPVYRDTVEKEQYQVVPVKDIYYFPESQEMTYMFVGAFDVTGDEPASMDSYVGAGEQIYMSAENLYVARHVWKESTQTHLYRFHVEGSSLVYAGEAALTGQLLNQYSMDEYKGVLRVALTDWNTGSYVYTLDVETMQGIARTEALAPGESIQSVRYMGDIAYVVTFRQTDPLFAIDLTDPRRPTVLGQLKIPGFSTYLHPVGDGLLIGFGRNVLETYVDLPEGGREVVGTIDFGMKVSLFDVSDPKNPKEIDVLLLGRDTYSSAFNNPRAMMVDAKRGIFGFGQINYNKNESLYRLIEVRDGKLKDLASLKDAHSSDYDYDRRRLCYVGETLYGVSDSGVTAFDYNTLKLLDSLSYT